MPVVSRYRVLLRAWPIGLVVALALLTGGDSPDKAVAGVVLVVNSNGDQSDAVAGGACDVNLFQVGDQCTLRAALELSVSNTVIRFDLANCPGAGCNISPGSDLPAADDTSVQIDGTTEPDYAGTPLVTLDGTGGGATNGLTLAADNIEVRGLVIRDFSGAGIFAQFSGYIYGWIIGRNVITNNGGVGISLPPGQNGGGTGHQILDNVISDNGGDGINGATCPQAILIARNVISGQTSAGESGIEICGVGNEAHFNRIFGNDIGIDELGEQEALLAENNWFGCNEGPSNSDCDSLGVQGSTDADPWLVMSFGALPGSIVEGEQSQLKAEFTRNSDDIDVSGLGHLPDGQGVLFETDLGNVGSPAVLKMTTDGVATATLTADGGPGTANVSATSDNETQTDQVLISAPTPTPTPTEAATDTPTATPSDTGTATVTATPLQLIQGDVNCDQVVDEEDALIELLVSAGFAAPTPPLPCLPVGSGDPRAGDLNCDGVIDIKDMLAIMAYKAGASPQSQHQPCTPVGEALLV